MITNKYKLDRNNIVVPKQKSEFEYTDGDEIEEKIFSILKSTKDLSVASDELRGKIWNWASEYHFSPTRVNLLAPFSLKSFPKILEIGPGCGAITRFFGELGNQVYALEGSYRRASITAERCRDLSNVHVICDNFQNFESDIRFDCLSMIGVLEYSPRFFGGDNPVGDALTRAFDLLDDNGVMILAIENQLGLKYFNGCREDHLGELFAGINNLYNQNTAITFGKKDLEARIMSAGFNNIEFIYPFPDYKLPQLLVRQEALQSSKLAVGNIVGQYSDRDYLDQAEKFLVENLVWPVLDQNQLLADLANSFLVFAFKGPRTINDVASPWLIKSYCGHRKKQFLTENTFCLIDGKITVKKDRVYNLDEALNPVLKEVTVKHQIGESVYLNGNPYNLLWLKNLFGGNPFQQYVAYLKPWIRFLKNQIIKENDTASGEEKNFLPGSYLDCIPNNLIITEGEEICFYDREWVFQDLLELEFVVFRGVLHDVMRYSYWYQKTDLFNNMKLINWFEAVFFELGLDIPGNRILNEFLELELNFQREVDGIFNRYDSSIEIQQRLKQMQDDFSNKKHQYPATRDLINTQSYISKEKEKRAIQAERNALEAERNTIEREYYLVLSKLKGVNALVDDIKNGPSWKIGRKVTWAPRKIKALIRSVKDQSIWRKMAILLIGFSSMDRLLQSFFKDGLKGVKRRLGELQSEHHYNDWYATHYRLTKTDRTNIIEHIGRFKQTPLISILMPTYNTPERWLTLAIESVKNQLYSNWELCIVDDASTDPAVRQQITQYAEDDKRIKPYFRETNGHISVASNTGLEYAQGEFVALLDHDDELTEDALYYIVNEINTYPDAQLFYSDEDKIDVEGNLSGPYFKPDWDPGLIYSHNFVCHLGVYRRDVLKQIDGFQQGFEGAQDWDLCLRFVDQISPDQIRHIPRILYHWRMIPGSTGLDIKYKDYAIEAAKKTIEESLVRKRKDAEVIYHVYNESFSAFRVRYAVQDDPLVTLIILTRDGLHFLSKSVESILAKTTYNNYELIIVDNGSEEKETLDYLKNLADEGKARIIRDGRPFNFAALNNLAVKKSKGSVVGLINNDIEVIDGDWLREMVSFAVQPEVGAVGCRLLYPDNTVQHAGVFLGLGGFAGHAYKHFPADHPGQYGRAKLIQCLTAVTGACMMLRKEIYDEMGGMDEENFAVAYNDIDLCLRIRAAGYLITFTPFAELYHHESASRGYEDTLPKIVRFDKEKAALAARWGDKISIDPYYNPNLTLDREDLSLADPPRLSKPWVSHQKSITQY